MVFICAFFAFIYIFSLILRTTCSPLGLHGGFGVLIVQLFQGALLAFGQGLRLPCRRVAGFPVQNTFRFADDLVQHLAHTVHHLGDSAALPAVLFSQSPLMLYPTGKRLLTAKHAAHGVRRDFLARLCIAQFLSCFLIALDVALHQVVHAFKALLLRQVPQRSGLQFPAARLVPGVVLVHALVQNGSEGVCVCLRTKVHLTQRRVHIAPGILFQTVAHRYGGVAGCGIEVKQHLVLFRHKCARLVLHLPGPPLVRQAGRAVPGRLNAVHLSPVIDHLQGLGPAGGRQDLIYPHTTAACQIQGGVPVLCDPLP